MLVLPTTVNFATGFDVEEMGALSRRDIESGLGWKYTPAHLRTLIRDTEKNVVAARLNASLAGFGVMSYGEITANLDLLAVSPRFRRRGVGKQLVSWLEEVADTAGIFTVYVQVRRSNTSALRFYESHGYEFLDTLNGYYHGKEDALLLGRTLRGVIDRE